MEALDSLINKTIRGEQLNEILQGIPLFRLVPDNEPEIDKESESGQVQILVLVFGQTDHKYLENHKYAQKITITATTRIRVQNHGLVCENDIIFGKVHQYDDLMRTLFSESLNDQNLRNWINNLIAKNGMLIRYIDKTHRTYDQMMSAVTQNGFAIRYIDQSVRTQEMMIRAIESNWRSIIFIDQQYRDMVLMTRLVMINGMGIRNIDPKYRTDGLIELAIQNNGLAIQYIDPMTRIRINGLVEKAVRQNGLSVRYLKDEMMGFDKSLIVDAVKQNCCSLNFIDQSLITKAIQCLGSITARRIGCPRHYYMDLKD